MAIRNPYKTGVEHLAFIRGYQSAVCDYAVWKDGKQYVGVMQRPLAEVLHELEEQINKSAVQDVAK